MAVGLFGVLLLCAYSLASVTAVDQVNLAVYYESLCPDSKIFLRDQLTPTYEKLSKYMTVELVPFGNAHYKDKSGKYPLICQHGPEECKGNRIQACYIYFENNTKSQIDMVNCAFKSHDQGKSLHECVPKDVRPKVEKCVKGSLGSDLEYEMWKKTNALSPPHNFIPWITVNGVGSTDLNDKMNDDLFSVMCDYLKDQKLEICNKKWSPFNSLRNMYL